VVFLAGGFVTWRYVLPWWRTQPPPASGGELTVRILDVGPINGDSILITSPSGKTVLIDAGDTTKGKAVVDTLKRNNIQQLDYFIATHPHPDHMGGSAEVFKAVKVLNVIDNGQTPSLPPGLAPSPSASGAKKKPTPTPTPRRGGPPAVTKFYDDYKAALTTSGAHYETARPGTKYDLGGGALLTVLAPSEPFFTREQMRTGGNEPNANSVVMRLEPRSARTESRPSRIEIRFGRRFSTTRKTGVCDHLLRRVESLRTSVASRAGSSACGEHEHKVVSHRPTRRDHHHHTRR
jgi:beta-lactamase superfamily II metal-dependent hydrolase